MFELLFLWFPSDVNQGQQEGASYNNLADIDI
jgi:hypothetical protein